MVETCPGNSLTTFLGTQDELKAYFPNLEIVPTIMALHDKHHRSGVRAVILEKGFRVNMAGKCPNLTGEVCILGERCFSNRNAGT